MTPLESILLATGMMLLGRFAVAIALPASLDSLKGNAEENSRSLREEFVFLSPRTLQCVAVAAGILACLAAIGTLGIIAGVLAGGCSSILVPVVLVRTVRKRRKTKLARQLPSTLRLLASSVRAGNSLPQAIFQAVPLLPPGMRSEAEWLCSRHRLGVPVWEIFREWEERMSSEDFRLVLRPLRMSLRSGGNVAELLDRCRQVLESRRRAADRHAALTAQGRMQALVLSLMPPLLLFLLLQVDPGSRERLFASPPGQALLGASALLQIAGWFMVRRITRVVR